jgi:DNA-binding transcriptional LysR family regulator
VRTELLEAFVAVAEERHFGRAAERLHIGQSPLSQQIRRLEREVGTPLFTRTTRNVELTDAGRVLQERARTLLNDLAAATGDARRAADGQLGRITIGFTGSATFSIMPALAASLRQRLPAVTLDLRGELLTPAQVARLSSGAREPLLAVLPAAHPLSEQAEIRVADLADSPFVAYPSAARSVLHEAVEKICQEHGFHPRVQLEVAETATLVAFVAAGIGVSLVPAAVANLAINGAVYRPLADTDITVELALAWRRDDTSSVVARTLDLIREHMNASDH